MPDTVGIREVIIKRLKPNSYYLLLLKNGKYSFDFIRIGLEFSLHYIFILLEKENSWALCPNKESKPYTEIKESLIKWIFLITLTIRKEDD